MPLLIDAGLIVLNVIAFAMMLRFGRRPEHWAVGLIVTFYALEILLSDRMLGDWRIGAAAANLYLFGGLWMLCERWGRWWLVFAAGFQLVILLTHVLPFLSDANLINTGVIVRKLGWAAISLTLFIAAWEAWADRRYRLERGANPDDRSPTPDGHLAPAADAGGRRS